MFFRIFILIVLVFSISSFAQDTNDTASKARYYRLLSLGVGGNGHILDNTYQSSTSGNGEFRLSMRGFAANMPRAAAGYGQLDAELGLGFGSRVYDFWRNREEALELFAGYTAELGLGVVAGDGREWGFYMGGELTSSAHAFSHAESTSFDIGVGAVAGLIHNSGDVLFLLAARSTVLGLYENNLASRTFQSALAANIGPLLKLTINSRYYLSMTGGWDFSSQQKRHWIRFETEGKVTEYLVIGAYIASDIFTEDYAGVEHYEGSELRFGLSSTVVLDSWVEEEL